MSKKISKLVVDDFCSKLDNGEFATLYFWSAKAAREVYEKITKLYPTKNGLLVAGFDLNNHTPPKVEGRIDNLKNDTLDYLITNMKIG